MKVMSIMTHNLDDRIPVGKAVLVIDDNGWVGTNIGCPFHGQPALFPEAQARAIAYAWNSLRLIDQPTLNNMSSDVQEWLS